MSAPSSGNLYHLIAGEKPDDSRYPEDPRFKKKYGPRGAIKSEAAGIAGNDRSHDPLR